MRRKRGEKLVRARVVDEVVRVDARRVWIVSTGTGNENVGVRVGRWDAGESALYRFSSAPISYPPCMPFD
jgi:hypothetical protein